MQLNFQCFIMNDFKIDILVLRNTTLHSSGKFHLHLCVCDSQSCTEHSLPALLNLLKEVSFIHSVDNIYWVSEYRACSKDFVVSVFMYLFLWKVLKCSVFTILIFQTRKWGELGTVSGLVKVTCKLQNWHGDLNSFELWSLVLNIALKSPYV